jgi:hypothetical protein
MKKTKSQDLIERAPQRPAVKVPPNLMWHLLDNQSLLCRAVEAQADMLSALTLCIQGIITADEASLSAPAIPPQGGAR